MAGHSHWAQIKRAKGANDAKRGQLFSKLSREISVAARLGGGDPSMNARLRSAISTAKAESMPADTIERAVKKGTGELGADQVDELVYEGYAPGGIAIMAEAMTNNKNRTAAEVRAIFTRYGGNLGGAGSVAWMFRKKACFFVEGAGEDAVLEAALEAGAEDVAATPEGVTILAAPEQFDAVEKALRAAGFSPKTAKFSYLGENPTPLNDPESAQKVFQLIEKLEEHEDVQNVYANYDLSAEVASQLT